MEVLHSEVGGGHPVAADITHHFVGRFRGDGSMVEGEKIATEVEGVIACGEAGGKKSACRCIFHHQVDGASDAITLHFGGHRLVYLDARQDLRGEKIEGHEAVLIVRTRYFDTIHQGVVISLIHAAEYGILTLAR